MLVTFVLLAILTIGAVSASDDINATETLTADVDEVSVDASVDNLGSEDGGEIVAASDEDVIPVGNSTLMGTGLEVNVDDAVYGDPVNIEINVIGVESGIVHVNVGGEDYTLNFMSHHASLSLNDLDLGSYRVLVSYPGDSYHAAAECFSDFRVVESLDVEIDMEIDMKYAFHLGDTVKVNVSLGENATGMAFATLNGVTYNSTVDNGTCSFEFSGLEIGLYDLTIEYVRDENYSATEYKSFIILPPLYTSDFEYWHESYETRSKGYSIILQIFSEVNEGALTLYSISEDGNIKALNITIENYNELYTWNYLLRLDDLGLENLGYYNLYLTYNDEFTVFEDLEFRLMYSNIEEYKREGVDDVFINYPFDVLRIYEQPGIIEVYVNGSETASKPGYRESDIDWYPIVWNLDELGITSPGKYNIFIKALDHGYNLVETFETTLNVMDFNNSQFYMFTNYEGIHDFDGSHPVVYLYCPVNSTGNVTVYVNDKLVDREFPIASDDLFSFTLSDLNINENGNYEVRFMQDDVEIGSVDIEVWHIVKDYDGIELWVNTEDEFSTNPEDLGAIFATVAIPEGILGQIIFSKDENLLYKVDLSIYVDHVFEGTTFNIALNDTFFLENLNDGDLIRFAFLENGTELAGQEYFVFIGEDTIRFEINAHNPGDEVSIDVSGDEIDMDDDNHFVFINLPSNVTEGKVIVTSGDYTLFEESVNFDNGTHWWTEIDGHYVCSFGPDSLTNMDKLQNGDIVTFAFINGEFDKSKEYKIYFEDNIIRFEECKYVDVWYSEEKLYTDSIVDVVSISVPHGVEGTIHVEVDGEEKASWEIEFYDEDYDSYYGWRLADLEISDAGNYTITVKLDEEILRSENVTVCEFNNDTFRAMLNYDDELIRLYCPEGIEGTLRIATFRHYDEGEEMEFDESYDIADYPGWSEWKLSDLGLKRDFVWTEFVFIVKNTTGDEIFSFYKGYAVSDDDDEGDDRYYLSDEVKLDNREDMVIYIEDFPEDIDDEFTVIVSRNGTVITNKTFDIYDDKDGEYWLTIDELEISEYGEYDILLKFTKDGEEIGDTYSGSFNVVPFVVNINDRYELTDIFNYIYEIELDKDAEGSVVVYLNDNPRFASDLSDLRYITHAWQNGFFICLNDLNITESGEYKIRMEIFDGEGNLLRNISQVTKQVNVEDSTVELQSKDYGDDWIADLYIASPVSKDARVEIYVNGTLAGESMLFYTDEEGFSPMYSGDVYFNFNENFTDDFGCLKVGHYYGVVCLIDGDKNITLGEGEFSVIPLDININIWDSDDEILYNDSEDRVLGVDVPRCYGGAIIVLVNGEEVDSWTPIFDEYSMWRGNDWGLEDLGMTEAGNYTVVVKLNDELLRSENITVSEFKYDAFRAILDYENEIIKLFIPEGSEGNVTITNSRLIDDEEDIWEDVDSKTHEISSDDYGKWMEWNLEDLGFEHNGVNNVFYINVINSTGDEVYSFIVVHNVAHTEPLEDYEFAFVNPNDEFDDDEDYELEYVKSSNILVGFFYIPAAAGDADTTLYVYRNGELFKTFASNDNVTHGFFKHEAQARGFEVWLDLTQFSDKDVISFYLPDKEDDNNRTVVVEDRGSTIYFHDDYDSERFEFDVFYGNVTTGRLNNPELMGPRFDGAFFILTISDSYGITEGTIALSDGSSTIVTVPLSDCNKEYDYGSLGYTYSYNLTNIIAQIPTGKELTVAFNFDGGTFEAERILVGDYMYKVVLDDEIRDQFKFEVTDDVISNETDTVISMGSDSNRQSIYIDFGGGYFTVYVNDVKVENLGNVSFNTWLNYSNWEENDYEYLEEYTPYKDAFIAAVRQGWGSELELFRLTSWNQGAPELNITLADLNITKSGTYNIRITHYPSVPGGLDDHENMWGDENEGCEYLAIRETEIINKNIVVKLEEAILPVDLRLTINVDDVDYGTDALVTVTANETFTGDISVQIGNAKYSVSLINGTGSTPVSNLNADTYTATATFEGNESFNADEANTTFTVNKVNSTLDVSGVALTYGASTTAVVTTEGAIGIRAKINNKDVTVEGNVIAISGLGVGSYDLTVTTIADGNHNEASKTVTVTVNPASSSVDASDLTVAFGDAISVPVSSINASGVNYVIFNDGGIVKEGAVVGGSISGISLAAGAYGVNLTTVVDANHTAASKTITITVNKAASSVNVSDVSLDYGASTTVAVSSEGAIGINAKIDGKNVDVVDNVIAISGLSAGSHTLTVTTIVDANHSAASKTATITVRKLKSTISLTDDIVFDYGSSGSSEVSFTGADGVAAKVIDHSEANVVINGSVITVSGLDAGAYILEVTTRTDDNHEAVSVRVNITVNKLSTAVKPSATKITTTYGTSKNIVVTLKDADGNPLANKTVTVKLNNVVYTRTTKANGQVSVTIPKTLAVKNAYTASISFAGDKNYIKSSSTTKVVVNKATPKIIASAKSFKRSGTKKYTITLKTDKNALLKSAKVSIKLNGVTYSGKTNSKGQFTIQPSNLNKKGKYTATIKFAGDAKYKAVSKSVKITVN